MAIGNNRKKDIVEIIEKFIERKQEAVANSKDEQIAEANERKAAAEARIDAVCGKK